MCRIKLIQANINGGKPHYSSIGNVRLKTDYILTSAHDDEFKERVATLRKADYESLPSAPVLNLNARSL